MESVMSFLADNYIWFFVAAGVLCFALIGFIIDSKKKKKNEFKGESIAEDSIVPNESVDVVGETVNMEGEATLENSNFNNEMQINDIPLNNEVDEPVVNNTEADNAFEETPVSMEVPDLDLPNVDVPEKPLEEVATVENIFEPTMADKTSNEEVKEEVEIFDEL